MSQDQLNLIAPEEENTEEIQQLPVEDEENTPEMAMQLGLPPPEPLDLSGGNISANWKKLAGQCNQSSNTSDSNRQ